MDRFHIVVYNYGRVRLFLDNFWKIRSYTLGIDKVYIYDCSTNWLQEQKEVYAYCQREGLRVGVDFIFERRVNWGIDQGARVDYASTLHASGAKSKFLWQFQEHYLDTESAHSRWPEGTINVDGKDYSGQIKGDCIADSTMIDLDECQRILDQSDTAIIHADRLGIGFFPYAKPPFFCVDGGNFCCSTRLFAQILDEHSITMLRRSYDSSYEWALFAEHYIGMRATHCGGVFYDLRAKISYSSIDQLAQQIDGSMQLFHKSEEYYESIVKGFLSRFSSNTLQSLSLRDHSGATTTFDSPSGTATLIMDGSFTSWDEALSQCTTYADPAILEKVLSSTMKVKRGEVAYERDSVCFDSIQYSWPSLAALMLAAALSEGRLNVLDFGGSLGTSYFQCKKFIDLLPGAQWNIVEQENYVAAGQENIQNETIRFYTTIDECLRQQSPNVLLLSGVLNYIRDPYALLRRLLETNINVVIIDRLCHVKGDREVVNIQHVPESIYRASYPCRLLLEECLRTFMASSGYRLVEEFTPIDETDESTAYMKGYIYLLQSSLGSS